MKEIKTLKDLLSKCLKFDSKTICMAWQEDNQRKTLSFSEFHSISTLFGKGLLSLGLQPQDKVVVISGNRPEWLYITMGINAVGLVDVPRGENTTEDEINYIIEHSKAKIAIVENEALAEIVKQQSHKTLEKIFLITGPITNNHINTILEKGKKYNHSLPSPEANDTVSIIYTSGTTGHPKGVELTHNNFTSQIASILQRISLSQNDKCVSILPAWHAFERIVKYTAFASGTETFYSTQRTLMDDLEQEKPTIMASVPRIWEAIHSRIIKQINQNSHFKKALFQIASEASVSYKKTKNPYTPFNLLKAPFHHYLDKKVYTILRQKIGGRLRYIISGGSALPLFIDNFFHAAGIEILEGYGLTETAPVISFRVPGENALYTAGKLLDCCHGKIIDPETGELLLLGQEGVLYVKGANVMKGYYRNHEETEKVLHHDGWFNTGDRAYFNASGNLTITGREKDIIVLSNGENVNPIPIETTLTKSLYISSALVTGQDWRYLNALIVPDIDTLKDYCEKNNITFNESSIHQICNNKRICSLFKKEIKRFINRKNGFQAYESIQDFRLVPPFNVGRELTHTFKPKRAAIEKLYKKEIDSMKVTIN